MGDPHPVQANVGASVRSLAAIERQASSAPVALPDRAPQGHIQLDGKHFARGGQRFDFRGVTYGTFRSRSDGARYPEREQVRRDFGAIQAAGFTVVRTYTPPPDDVLELAGEFGLTLLVGIFYNDWRYLVGPSDVEVRALAKTAQAEVRSVARRLRGRREVFALALGNEVPADVLRWMGTRRVAAVIDQLVEAAKDEDPDRLVTYCNYPTAEYLPLDRLDFLTFNVFLEQRADYRSYLTRLHTLAGDRPLVLGEIGLNAGSGPEGERQQAEAVDWLLETAIERAVAGTCLFSWTDEWWVGDAIVGGWHFGLTRKDRSPRPALEVARRWNTRTVADLDFPWPSISVVICAYNAAATLEECLRASTQLVYPQLEILVVDDGSTDATAAIARRFPGVTVLSIPHGGLAVARNEGFKAARGSLIAYLDSDAYPSPEWPYYLALGMDHHDVGGVGGPNIPPPGDSAAAQRVAHAPGGPLHVLLSDDRAEHVPGCNMAFWKLVLEEVGGFDPVYQTAGDDVDLCWRVLNRGWQISFHPGALVWHHRRGKLKDYFRQQWGYGRSEALVEARHPDRFTAVGTARWRGHIYNAFGATSLRQRVYRGLYGGAAYQSVYRGGGHAFDLAQQLGVPLSVLVVATAPIALLWPVLGVGALAGLLALAALGVVAAARARPPHGWRGSRLGFRVGVAALHLVQPVARMAGRLMHTRAASRDLPPAMPLPSPVLRAGGGVLLLPADRPRAQLAAALVTHLRRAGLRVIPATGWEDYDARILGSLLIVGDLVTSAHPEGSVQLKVRRRPRLVFLGGLLAVVAGAGAVAPLPAAVLALVGAVEVARGWWRTGPLVRRVVGGGNGLAKVAMRTLILPQASGEENHDGPADG